MKIGKRITIRLIVLFLFFYFLLLNAPPVSAQSTQGGKIPVTVEHHLEGAPLTFGIPFPKGVLSAPEKVRVLNSKGEVIPSQITQVNTWEPADPSIQWIWVFIFADEGNTYTIEYGEGISSPAYDGEKIKISNHWVDGGKIRISTGAMDFYLTKGIGGFLNEVKFKGEDTPIAEAPEAGRGTFVDLLDEQGMDPSKAEIVEARLDKGSGPMHAIIHVEGIYHYSRMKEAPFEMHLHAYAGKTYLQVLHTMIYTGQPTQHPPLEGQHAMVATSLEHILNEDSLAKAKDPRWTQPKDQIAQMGLNIKYNLDGEIRFRTSYRDGKWWEEGNKKYYEVTLSEKEGAKIFQTGDNPSRIPPLENSPSTQRMEGGFRSEIAVDGKETIQSERGEGWIDLSDQKWGIGVGIRHFFKEYPKGISIDGAKDLLHVYAWSPDEDPMSFARYDDSTVDGNIMDNFAQGVAKTTENVFYFHPASVPDEQVEHTLNYFLDPPVAHADPQWYAESKVFGDIAAADNDEPALERGLQYKYQWMLFNQDWEPWYGMWDYGEVMNYYFDEDWFQWSGNEPAQDFMWWLNFIRSGDRASYLQGQAISRYAMDINQIHWPKDSVYKGDSNPSLDYFKSIDAPKGSPYIGMGRRHAVQHWIALLSAHIWVQGLVSAYFISADNRALEVAKETGNYYTRRIFGDHGLLGRRLYLSIWNLDWIYNATKDPKYGEELDDRVNRLLELQRQQEGNLVADRYDYAQAYASLGLEQYLNFTGKKAKTIEASLVENARRLRDVPPWGHEYESYLATIHPLVLGYKYSGDKSFLEEAARRSEVLKMDELPRPFSDYSTQQKLEKALEAASRMPKEAEPYEQIEMGLDVGFEHHLGSGEPIWRYASGMRVFAWTHIFHVPWVIHYLDKQKQKK